MFGLDTILKSKAGKKQIKKLVETELLPNFIPALESYALEQMQKFAEENKCNVAFMAFQSKEHLFVGTAFLDENKTIIRVENVQLVTEFVKIVIEKYFE
ncbi:MAG: hypothetical protein FWC39_07375 [Bacteroidetes bacterium]|nr:hypothetical protein [Bacteroidota bacterium]